MKHTSFILLCLYCLVPCHAQRKQVEKHAQGLVKREYFVKKGVRQGAYTEYFDRVKITEGQYADGLRVGLWNFRDCDGGVSFSGKYTADEPDSVWVYRDKEHVLSEIYYDWGEVDSVKGYYENGTLAYELRYEGNAVENIGLAKAYWPNGQIKEVFPIRNSKLDGVYEAYFENGQLHRQTEYKEGQRYSVLGAYAPDGTPCEDGTLQHGEGFCLMYYLPEVGDTSSLKPRAMYNYKEGVLVGEKLFELDGKTKGVFAIRGNKRISQVKATLSSGDPLLTITSEQYHYTEGDWGEEKGRMPLMFEGDLSRDSTFSRMPAFQQGNKGLVAYFTKEIKYPKTAVAVGAGGKVEVVFRVSSTGEIEGIKIFKGSHMLLNKSAVEVVRNAPRFTPSFTYGVPVWVTYTLPVNFQNRVHWQM